MLKSTRENEISCFCVSHEWEETGKDQLMARDALVELGGRVCAGLSEVLGAEGFLRAKVLG